MKKRTILIIGLAIVTVFVLVACARSDAANAPFAPVTSDVTFEGERETILKSYTELDWESYADQLSIARGIVGSTLYKDKGIKVKLMGEEIEDLRLEITNDNPHPVCLSLDGPTLVNGHPLAICGECMCDGNTTQSMPLGLPYTALSACNIKSITALGISGKLCALQYGSNLNDSFTVSLGTEPENAPGAPSYTAMYSDTTRKVGVVGLYHLKDTDMLNVVYYVADTSGEEYYPVIRQYNINQINHYFFGDELCGCPNCSGALYVSEIALDQIDDNSNQRVDMPLSNINTISVDMQIAKINFSEADSTWNISSTDEPLMDGTYTLA